MHTTTKFYDPKKTAKGNMVELLSKWKKRGWSQFFNGGGNSTPAAGMQCPHCSGMLAPSGKLLIKPDPKPAKTQAQRNQEVIDEAFKKPETMQETIYICSICGRKTKGIGGHAKHVKACERRQNAGRKV
jgi:DNA-directed RNA polymerase subunit RPC12/RpoP